jgi:glycosyltransferase 2 family protein
VTEPLSWLTRTYFVSYAAGQVLPTSIGGDAVRVFETARRHPGRAGLITGSVLLDRALGGAATLVLAAVGFVIAIGEYDVGAYLWLEGALVLGTVAAGIAFFSRRARRPLARLRPLFSFLRLERPLRAVYEGVHTYRTHAALLAGLLAFTVVLQAIRVLPIWLVGKSVGIDLSPKPYYVMGPILFVVLLAPFTINGLAVREAFFVSFLGNLGVAAEPAFAAGFLFFLVTILMAVPGALILGWEALHRA